MITRDLRVDAYLKLHELIASRSGPPLVPFLGFAYSEGSPDIRYQWQENGFTRELVNAFNTYAFWADRLSLWEEVLCDYARDDILKLRWKFTMLPFDYCLSFPHRFRSRIIFYATQLCFTKGLLVKALEEVDGEQYREATRNYRNKSQHRHPQCLDSGQIASITRSSRRTPSAISSASPRH
jgi:hypothetical protein